jgi:hypothetical protein
MHEERFIKTAVRLTSNSRLHAIDNGFFLSLSTAPSMYFKIIILLL